MKCQHYRKHISSYNNSELGQRLDTPRCLFWLEPAQANQTKKRPICEPVRENGALFWTRGVLPGKKRRSIHKNHPIFAKIALVVNSPCFFPGRTPPFRKVPCFCEPARESAIFSSGLSGRVPICLLIGTPWCGRTRPLWSTWFSFLSWFQQEASITWYDLFRPNLPPKHPKSSHHMTSFSL